jgi:hypothetical protein
MPHIFGDFINGVDGPSGGMASDFSSLSFSQFSNVSKRVSEKGRWR